MVRALPSWLVPAFLCVAVLFTFFLLPPRISSDSTSYIEAMGVVMSGEVPSGFRPNRILTTFGGIETVIIVALFTRSILVAWYLVNAFFYVAGFWLFFLFLRRFLKDEKSALFGTALLALNYVSVSFGLNYLMDMGGWFFYLLAVYFAERFLATSRTDYFLWGGLIVGVGGLFKEYAFLGAIPLVAVAVFKHRTQLVSGFKKTILFSIILALPVLLFYMAVYQIFGYTYADWFSFNEQRYGSSYASRVVEYIKVFGSLFTFAWFLVVPGAYLIARRGKEYLDPGRLALLAGIALSALPVFLWPAVTQRIFFVPVVLCVILASAFVRYAEIRPAVYMTLFYLYVLTNFLMDSTVLPLFNLGDLFTFLK